MADRSVDYFLGRCAWRDDDEECCQSTCRVRENCQGCGFCCVLKCSLCMERGLDNTMAKGGSSTFLKSTVVDHAQTYHREKFPDLDRSQTLISERLEKQLKDQEGMLKGKADL